jgi:hypothetical protein
MIGNKTILIATMIGLSFLAQAQDVQLNSRQATFQSNNIKVEIYPNPATDYLTVDLTDAYVQNVEFELRSMIGNSIRINPESIGYNKYRIALKDYATGYYFLIVRDEHIRFKKAFKFLKR